MSTRIQLETYLPGMLLECIDDEAIAWFNNSELANDERTARVAECLDAVYSSTTSLDEEAITALNAGLYHRATAISTGPDGDPIDALEDIPGLLGQIEYAVLRGYPSKAALKQHCTVTEEIAAAAVLNMATRWANGKKAHKWTFEAVDDAYRPDYEPKHVTTRQRAELQRLQSDLIDD